MTENYDKGFDALFQGYYGQAEEIDLIELARRILAMPLNADRLRAGTIEANRIGIFADFDGPASLVLDKDGFRGTDGMNLTFEINTQGKAFFRGDITSEATITGSTIRTGQIGTNRIELTGGGLYGVTSSEQLSGLVYNMGPTGIVDLYLFHNNVPLVEFYDEANLYAIRGTTQSSALVLGGIYAKTQAEGDWDFTLANVSGLNFNVPTTTDVSGSHNHGIADGTVLQKADGGTVIWRAYGGHSHSLVYG